jgi:MinD-like ATPase involved in chromosome partitioning or flagellar assembly
MNGVTNAENNINKVLHLFASSAEAMGRFERNASRKVSMHSCCLLCAGGGIVQTFYFCNLGICLAKGGLDFSLLDLETRLPTSSYLLGKLIGEASIAGIAHASMPPWDCLYENCSENHIALNSNSTLRLLELNRQTEGKSLFQSNGDGKDVFEAFRALISNSDMTWINLPESFLSQNLAPILGVRKFLLITKPDLKNIIQTFELIKRISKTSSAASFGILFHRTGSGELAHSAFAALARAVRLEIEKDIVLVGQLPEHPAIAESILERSPLALNRDYPEMRKRFEEISHELTGWVQKDYETVVCDAYTSTDKNAGQGI